MNALAERLRRRRVRPVTPKPQSIRSQVADSGTGPVAIGAVSIKPMSPFVLSAGGFASW